MEIWFLMLGCDLLQPLMLLIVGLWMRKAPPKNINHFAGYRTSTSMKNQDTWDFAQAYSGKMMCRLGWISILVAVIPMLFVIGASEDVISIVGLILCGVLLIPLLLVVPLTEKALQKAFDKDGSRR